MSPSDTVGCAARTAERTWSAAQAAAASRDFAELHAAHGGVLWVEFDPASGRCSLQFLLGDWCRELTPPGYSVRSKVYEYGGGASCATERGVAFVNEADQQVYHLDLAGGAPRALSTCFTCRYGDLAFVPAWQALLAVEESHEPGEVAHRIVRLGLDGTRQVLVQGAAFYAAPTVDEAGERLAWIEWDRPRQPWTATRLCLRHRSPQGDWSRTRVLAGDAGKESLQQPRFDADGRLHCLSDRHGWWQPLAEAGDGLVALLDAPFDHAPAPWQLGGRSYLPLTGGTLLASRIAAQGGELLERSGEGRERRLAGEFSRFRALAADPGHFYCVAAAPDRLPAVLAIDRRDGGVQVLAGGERPLDDEHLPRPEAIAFASGGETAHGYFYPARAGGPTPLVVFLHGGPTSACYPVFDPRIPFWTQRGFAVADLNYRGSSGYGRAYRQRLQGEWGRIEVEDIQAAAAHLATAGLVDGARVFVRGASAGGYSALCALAGASGLRGGASLYGVSDPLALRRATHKFEADYLDWLIGDPERDAARYRERTPLLQAARIRVPVIFFQGGLDAVVVPAQTESMVAALRGNGLAVAYHLYPDERHGFRQAAHLAEVLERELAFYVELLR